MDRHLQDLGRLRHRRVPDRHRQARQHRVLAEVLARRCSARGQASGNDDFFMFGEVYDADPAFMSQYTTDRQSCRPRSTSGSRRAASDFAQGRADDRPARPVRRRRLLHRHRLQRLRPADVPRQPRHGPRSAYSSSGDRRRRTAAARRAGALADVPDPRAAGRLLRRRAGLHRRRAATRTPGRTCSPARSPSYNDDDLIGSAATTGSTDRYGTDAPMYQHDRRAVARCAPTHPALADGAQIHRYASDAAGIYAFSRVDARRAGRVPRRRQQRDDAPRRRRSHATAEHATFTPLYGGGDAAAQPTPRAGSRSPCRRCPWRCARPTSRSPRSRQRAGRLPARRRRPARRSAAGPRSAPPCRTTRSTEVTLRLPAGRARRRGSRSAPTTTRRTACSTTSPGCAKGTLVEYRAVLQGRRGQPTRRPSTYGIVGDPPPPAAAAAASARRRRSPTTVSVPGDHNSEMGCAGDWAAGLRPGPADAATRTTRSGRARSRSRPAPYAYKVGDQQAPGTRTTAPAASRTARTSRYTVAGDGPVTFYYDHRTHWVTSTPQGPIVTAPGSFQSELGCPATGPRTACGRGCRTRTATASTRCRPTQIPAGGYEVKVAHGLSWDENYGAGGAPGGANIPFTVGRRLARHASRYVLATHVLTVTTSPAGCAAGPEPGQGALARPAT